MMNGKVKFKLWASRNSESIIGRTFHLNPLHLSYLCGELKKAGWKINQIKKVVI